MNTPLIKWTGSKRSIASTIVKYFPDNIDTYYEPFLGGGSVFFELLRSGKQANHYVLTDINPSLVDIFKIVKDQPKSLIDSYEKHWKKLQDEQGKYFYEIRKLYNHNKDPHLFYFLTRTCYNGTIRHNKKGEFNTSYHFGRPGASPEKIKEIVNYYAQLMSNKNITFDVVSFLEIVPKSKNDVLYLDPPYTNSKSLYFGDINIFDFTEWLKTIRCNWFLNINGINGKDNGLDLPISYTDKLLLKSGNSSFSRMKGKQVNVKEYFFYKTYDKKRI